MQLYDFTIISLGAIFYSKTYQNSVKLLRINIKRRNWKIVFKDYLYCIANFVCLIRISYFLKRLFRLKSYTTCYFNNIIIAFKLFNCCKSNCNFRCFLENLKFVKRESCIRFFKRFKNNNLWIKSNKKLNEII